MDDGLKKRLAEVSTTEDLPSVRRGLMIPAMAMAVAERGLSTGEDTERTASGVLEIGVLSFKGFGFVSNS